MSEEDQKKVDAPEVETPRISPDQPWSVPETQERRTLPEINLDPLTSLPSSLAEAFADTLNIPQFPDESMMLPGLPEYNPVTQEDYVPLLRPPISMSHDACPSGLIGICVTCTDFPCDYMMERCLRYLLTQIKYGSKS